MRTKFLSATLFSLAAAAALTTSALAISNVSVGMLNGRSNEFDGTDVSVTGTIYVRGEGQFTQLCDDAMTCIYLDQSPAGGPPLSARAGETVTLAGHFHTDGIVKNTHVRNVLIVGV